MLNKLDLQTLIDMANKLETKGCSKKQLWTDSWDVAFLYNGKVNKIIELSPIPVDLHGWA